MDGWMKCMVQGIACSSDTNQFQHLNFIIQFSFEDWYCLILFYFMLLCNMFSLFFMYFGNQIIVQFLHSS